MIVGVDIGTQSLKAVVTDDALSVLGEASVAYEAAFPKPGWAEQDPGLWEAALGPAIAGALESAGADAAGVEALGVGGQLDGCVATDARGRALAPCIIWMDRRAAAEVADLPAGTIRERTGVIADATHMAAKIRWMKAREPRAKTAAMFHQPVSWMVARLTGEQVFDRALASTTMVYGLQERALAPDLLDLFGIDAAELPRLAEAHECAGTLTESGAALSGLPAGIPVAVGAGDDFTNLLGAGVVAPGRLVCTIGTAEVVGALSQTPLIDEADLLETHGFAGGVYFIENPGWLSGGIVSWFVETFGLSGPRELDQLAAAAAPGADGLTLLPAFSGAMAPEWIAGARGCWYGLTPGHGRGHMARAVLEGCAFAMRDCADRLIGMGVPIQAIRLLGGGARSRLWAQIRADLTGLPVEVPEVTDTSALGAALLASVAAGAHAGIEEAAGLVGAVARTIDPDSANRAAYDEAYGSYRALFEALRPMYGDGQ